MATRSIIYMEVKPQDIGKFKKCNTDNIVLYGGEDDWDDRKFFNGLLAERLKRVKIRKFVGIYHHNDGYLNELGKTLSNKFNTYDKALNLILCGDEISIVNHGKLKPYMCLNDNWDLYKPMASEYLPPSPSHNYDYLFKDGKWYFRHGNMERWRLLTKGIMRKFKD